MRSSAREVLEFKSGAFKHSERGSRGAQARRHCVRFLLTHKLGNIDELQARLARERLQAPARRSAGMSGVSTVGSEPRLTSAEASRRLRTCKSKPRAEIPDTRLRSSEWRRDWPPYASLYWFELIRHPLLQVQVPGRCYYQAII